MFIGCAFAIFCIAFAVLTYAWTVVAIVENKLWRLVTPCITLILMMLCEMISIASAELAVGL